MTETQITVQPKADAPAEWRNREDITALANRLKAMLPGSLSAQEALLLAQYSAAMDANPFRGEIYAYQSRGKLVLTEGYKLLVRWARRQCNFSDRYDRLNGGELEEGAIGFRCHILRDDARDTLKMLVEAGAPWKEAFDIVASSAVGIVTKSDMTSKQGKPIPPPKGWTWNQVARKRALKNALNLAYGAPSPREIAAETWRIEDTLTIPDDWQDTEKLNTAEAEANALYNAKRRLAEPVEESAAESTNLLFGPDAAQRAPEPESDDDATETPTNGLDKLLAEVNTRLAANGLEQYQSKDNMIKMLKAIGHRKYSAADHGTMVSQLIAQKEPKRRYSMIISALIILCCLIALLMEK